MTDLNEKALEAAVKADCAHDYGNRCTCFAPESTGFVCDARCSRVEAAIRTYLATSGIGAVVEATREAQKAFSAQNGTTTAIMDGMLRAAARIAAAVAALDKEPGE